MKTQIPKSIKVNMGGSYKLGMNEVEGLREAIAESFKPVRDALREKVYWGDQLKFENVEYKSRDGFIPYSHNCGGLAIDLIIPKCEEYSFGFIEFGECDGCSDDNESCTGDDSKYPEYSGQCRYESEGYLDARLRIWFKFEGINEDGELEFYLNASGGNYDAPYFRSIPTVFEASFTCKSVKGLKRAAAKHVKALVAMIEGKAVSRG